MKFGKRLCAFVLSAVMLLASVPAVSAVNGTIIMNLGSNVMTVNGNTVAIDVDPAIKPQVHTVNGYGYTMLPLRAVVESMGGQVYYDIATKNITMVYNGTTVTHVIGTSTAYVNGVPRELSIASYAANNRTYVHLRAIELLSSSIAVNWSADAPDRVEIVYPQNAPVTILPDAPVILDPGTTDVVGDVPVIIYPEGEEPAEPVDMDLHICNMMGETFTIETLLFGKVAKYTAMNSQDLDEIHYEKAEILSKEITPGYYNITAFTPGGIYDWKNIRLTGGDQYLNLYAGGLFHISDDPDDLGCTEYELGLLEEKDERTETVRVTIVNDVQETVYGFAVYPAYGGFGDPVFETDRHLGQYKNRTLTFELEYHPSDPYFTIVVQLESPMYLNQTIGVTYNNLEFSGEGVVVNLTRAPAQTTVRPLRDGEEYEVFVEKDPNDYEAGMYLLNETGLDFDELYIINHDDTQMLGYRNAETFYMSYEADGVDVTDSLLVFSDFEDGDQILLDRWNQEELECCELWCKAVCEDEVYCFSTRNWALGDFEFNLTLTLELRNEADIGSDITAFDTKK